MAKVKQPTAKEIQRVQRLIRRAEESLERWLKVHLEGWSGIGADEALEIFEAVRSWATKNPDLADVVLR